MTTSSGRLLRTTTLALACALAWPALAGAVENNDKLGDKLVDKSSKILPGKGSRPTPANGDAPAGGKSEPMANAQAVYQIILGEFALQRNRPELAAAIYGDLAQRSRDPQAVARSIEVAGFARQYNLALDNARLWVELEPESTSARETLVGLLILLDHLDEAAPYMEKLLAESKTERGEDFARINRLFSRHADKAAVRTLIDRLTEPYLNLPEAHYARAQAAFVAGEHSAALLAIRQAESLRPDWENAQLFEAQVLSRSGQSEAAIALLQRYAASHPKARDSRLHLTRLLVGEKRYSEARNELQQLLASFPDDTEVIYPAAILALQQNDLVTAEKQLRLLLDLEFADRNIVRYYLGQIADESNRPAEARDWYEQVTPGEHYLNARGRLATQLARDGKLDEARRALRSSHTSNIQERTLITLAEARLLRQAQRSEEAYELLNNALDKQPNQPDLLYDSAMLAERLKHFDVFEQRLRKLIKMQADNPQAYNALGYSFAERNIKLDEARKLIEAALQRAPEDPYILDSMGWVLYRLKDYAGALEHLERAYRQQPDAEIAAHLGEVLWQLGRHDDAQRTWNEAKKSSPGSEVLDEVMHKFVP